MCLTFLAMEVLDGDVVRLSSRGREAERDIVQVRRILCCVVLRRLVLPGLVLSCLVNLTHEKGNLIKCALNLHLLRV